jgi:hypothetical protein
MRVSVNTTSFEKQINNVIKYSSGFLEGAQKGKTLFLQNLGSETINFMKNYVDVSARSNPEALHHVYEWYQTGSPNARLFDLTYTISNLGLSISGTFKQSNSIKTNSRVPFYNKAMIMEKGINIHPLLILFSVLGGIQFFGPEGFLLGPLVLSMLFVLIRTLKNDTEIKEDVVLQEHNESIQ